MGIQNACLEIPCKLERMTDKDEGKIFRTYFLFMVNSSRAIEKKQSPLKRKRTLRGKGERRGYKGFFTVNETAKGQKVKIAKGKGKG